jgi:hypothetical protein
MSGPDIVADFASAPTPASTDGLDQQPVLATPAVTASKVTIRVERGKEAAPGIFEFSVPSLRLFGRSRQPLLDGCRLVKRTLGLTELAGVRADVFREGQTEPDISCPVLKGAELTVAEPSNGKIAFAKFRKFDSSVFMTNESEDAVT